MAAKSKEVKKENQKKTSSKTTSKVTKEKVTTGKPKSYTSDLRSNRRKQGVFALLALLIVFGVIVYANINFFVAATVNNQPIWRWQLLKELEKQGGKQVLENLVTQQLVVQEAQKQGISVTEDDLNKELERIESNLKTQGGDLDSLLAFQGQTRDEFKKSLNTRILIMKLLADKATVTDAEVQKFFEENKSQYPENTKFEDVKDEAKQSLLEQKVGQLYQEWLEGVKSSSKVNYLLVFN